MTEPVSYGLLASAGDGVSKDFLLPGAHGADNPPYEVIRVASTGQETALSEGVDWDRVSVGGALYARLSEALPVGETITRLRQTQPLQPTRFKDGRTFPARDTEASHDRTIRAVQDVAAAQHSVVRTPRNEPGVVLQSARVRADRILIGGPNGELLAGPFWDLLPTVSSGNEDWGGFSEEVTEAEDWGGFV